MQFHIFKQSVKIVNARMAQFLKTNYRKIWFAAFLKIMRWWESTTKLPLVKLYQCLGIATVNTQLLSIYIIASISIEKLFQRQKIVVVRGAIQTSLWRHTRGKATTGSAPWSDIMGMSGPGQGSGGSHWRLALAWLAEMSSNSPMTEAVGHHVPNWRNWLQMEL